MELGPTRRFVFFSATSKPFFFSLLDHWHTSGVAQLVTIISLIYTNVDKKCTCCHGFSAGWQTSPWRIKSVKRPRTKASFLSPCLHPRLVASMPLKAHNWIAYKKKKKKMQPIIHLSELIAGQLLNYVISPY